MISVIFTIFITKFAAIDSINFITFARNFSLTVIGPSIGMLGFIIAGVAILTGAANNNIIKNINRDKKTKAFILVMFSFYFISVILGLSIGLFVFDYILTWINNGINSIAVAIFALISCYLLSFSIIYSIALLGSCIKMLLVIYRYSGQSNKASTKKLHIFCP